MTGNETPPQVEPSPVETSPVETSPVETSPVEPSQIEPGEIEPGEIEPGEIEPSADEDWKNRVKAEDAALDQRFRDTSGDRPSAPHDSTAAEVESAPERQSKFPPANFVGMLGIFATQAMVALGVMPNPATRKLENNLPMARYFIDLLDILDQKTAGNLTQEEAAALEESLHSLRMAYVQRSKATT